MTFKDVMRKVRRIMLCGREDERKPSLEIGSPTDVRRLDAWEGMPSLTEFDKKDVREKASNDAIRLLSLRSHPPTQPSTPSTSNPPSRSPSSHLLNAASTNLPPTLPTPPRQKHTDGSSPPAFRVKSMWERTRRLSAGLTSLNSHERSSAGYYELDVEAGNVGADVNADAGRDGDSDGGKAKEEEDEAVVLLDMDFDDKGKDGGIDLDSPVSIHSGKSEGFEVQETIGGTPKKSSRQITSKDMEEEESSDSDMDAAVERRPLVVA